MRSLAPLERCVYPNQLLASKLTVQYGKCIAGIDLQEFAHKCQVGVAASTTVHEATNKKRAGGGPVMEVLVQGNQVAFASDLLLNHYQVWTLTQLSQFHPVGFIPSRIGE